MISNERPSPFRPRQPRYSQHQTPPRPPVNEDTLKSGQMQVERKTFTFLLKENPRGLEAFQHLLGEMTTAAQELSVDNPPQ